MILRFLIRVPLFLASAALSIIRQNWLLVFILFGGLPLLHRLFG